MAPLDQDAARRLVTIQTRSEPMTIDPAQNRRDRRGHAERLWRARAACSTGRGLISP